MMKIISLLPIVFSIGLLIPPLTAAAIEGDIAFEGDLYSLPQCTISEGARVEVNFGDSVSIRKIDGSQYRTAMNYQIDCEETSKGELALTLSLIGEAATFDGDALRSDRQSLGIKIYRGNTVFKPGETIEINKDAAPILEAVPVKDPNGKLTQGTFEAWATLSAQYQ